MNNLYFRIPSNPSRYRCASPTDTKYLLQGLLRRYTDYQPVTIEPIHPDVRLSMNALLDAVEALQSIPTEVHVNTVSQPQRKKPRKSNSQHRYIPQNTNSNLLTCPSLEQHLTPTLPFVPLRPLSVSPPR